MLMILDRSRKIRILLMWRAIICGATSNILFRCKSNLDSLLKLQVSWYQHGLSPRKNGVVNLVTHYLGTWALIVTILPLERKCSEVILVLRDILKGLMPKLVKDMRCKFKSSQKELSTQLTENFTHQQLMPAEKFHSRVTLGLQYSQVKNTKLLIQFKLDNYEKLSFFIYQLFENYKGILFFHKINFLLYLNNLNFIQLNYYFYFYSVI